MANPMRSVDLDALTARLAAFPASFADAHSQDLRERCARASLKARGIKLRGDKSAIEALVEYEVHYRLERVRDLDEDLDVVLTIPASGRPNRYSALRDFLVFARYRIECTKLGTSLDPRLGREARKSTARYFALTCDTSAVRSRRLSVEQVRRAEERTLQRFGLIYHLDQGRLLSESLLWALQILDACRAESGGRQIDAAKFEENARGLSLLSRLLDALQHAQRIEKADARDVAQGSAKRKLH
jgi:hypothetical protein